MGTRGLFGFKHKGKYYLIYNHCDSYYSGLGKKIVKEIKYMLDNNLLDKWIYMLENIKIIDYTVNPTEEDIKQLEQYTNLKVSSRSTNDWYCLTDGCDSLIKVLESGYILHLDTSDLYEGDVEFTYVLNFDNKTLEVGPNDYYAYPLDKLPNYGYCMDETLKY